MRVFFCILFLSISYPLLGVEWTLQRIKESKQHANRVATISMQRIEAQHGLHSGGVGLAMCGGPIRSIGLSFTTQGGLTISEARRILVASANEIVANVNAVPDMRQYLHNPPFSIRDAEVILFIHDKYDRRIYAPHIGSAAIVEGKLDYCYSDPEEKIYPYLKIIKETYEEALEAIRKEDEANNAQR